MLNFIPILDQDIYPLESRDIAHGRTAEAHPGISTKSSAVAYIFSFSFSTLKIIMSGKLVPLTVIKGAGHEFISLPQGENATVADFYSIRINTTDSPIYFTSGFYKIEAGPARPAFYTFEETKYVLNGQIDILDEATGITHHLVPRDFAFFNVNTKVQFSTKSSGLAFYAVTRPIKTPHHNLIGREEDVKAKLSKL